jgi:hypothetical protein
MVRSEPPRARIRDKQGKLTEPCGRVIDDMLVVRNSTGSLATKRLTVCYEAVLVALGVDFGAMVQAPKCILTPVMVTQS